MSTDSTSAKDRSDNHHSLKNSIEQAIPFVERAKLRVIHLERGKATCEIPLEPNKNHMGSMYAGAQFTLADITGGALFLASFDSETTVPTLKNLTMEFVKPATSDLHLSLQISEQQIHDMTQQAQAKGKAHCELEGQLCDRASEVVAHMKGDFFIVARTK